MSSLHGTTEIARNEMVNVLPCRQGMGVTGGSPIGFDVVCGIVPCVVHRCWPAYAIDW